MSITIAMVGVGVCLSTAVISLAFVADTRCLSLLGLLLLPLWFASIEQGLDWAYNYGHKR